MLPIHIAQLESKGILFLNELKSSEFQWFKMNSLLDKAEDTPVIAPSIAEAIQQGYKTWKEEHFRLVHCGFRYLLPERDEVGTNALFWQMALSYNTSNGQYFDKEVGHTCYVDFASQEALEIWRKIR